MVASDNELNLVSEAETGGQNTMKHREMLASPLRGRRILPVFETIDRCEDWRPRDASPRQISNRNKTKKKIKPKKEVENIEQSFHLVALFNTLHREDTEKTMARENRDIFIFGISSSLFAF